MLATDDIVVGVGNPELRLDVAAAFGPARASLPLDVEIGFGKGRFLLAAAERFPERNFLAVEYARALVRKVRDGVLRRGLLNVKLWHGDAKHFVSVVLPDASVSRLHVYFPDPWPKRRHAKNRFFAAPIPDVLARVMVPGGEVLLATDHDPYVRDTVERMSFHEAFVRTTAEEPFQDLPPSGFGLIFAAQGIPIYRAAWQRVGGAASPEDTKARVTCVPGLR